MPGRSFDGTAGVMREPRIGDIGTIVHEYDRKAFIVECVDADGLTVWLADFTSDEIEEVADGRER